METQHIANQLSELKQLIRRKAESEAIAKLFCDNNGIDLDSFEVLLKALFKLEFVEIAKDKNGFPIYKLTDIEKEGKKIFPDTFFKEAREGEYGRAITSCFGEEGVISPHQNGKSNNNSYSLTIRREQKRHYLAMDRDGNFSRLLAAGKVKIID